MENCCLTRLAEFIRSHRSDITSEWIKSVRRNVDQAQNLTMDQLMDHMPVLFDDLADLLQKPQAQDTPESVKRHAHAHGKHRWKEGYEVAELLREIGLIRRTILVDCIHNFAAANPDFGGEAKKQAQRIIYEFFDEVASDSTEQFVEEQQRKMNQFNEELERSNRQLYEANQRLAELDRSRLMLTKAVSHELGNMLQIQSSAVNLLGDESDEGVRTEVLSILHDNIGDMDKVLNQLFDYSEIIGGRAKMNLQALSPLELFDELSMVFAPLAQSQHMQLKGRCDPSLDVIVSDRLKIKQIVSNLLSNAIKYGKKPSQEEGTVHLNFTSLDDGRWTIVVKDEGPGIPKTELELVFREFHRINPTEAVGTGLGLSISKSLVGLLGGTISVQSEVGDGSCFEVILPKSANNEVQCEDEPAVTGQG